MKRWWETWLIFWNYKGFWLFYPPEKCFFFPPKFISISKQMRDIRQINFQEKKNAKDTYKYSYIQAINYKRNFALHVCMCVCIYINIYVLMIIRNQKYIHKKTRTLVHYLQVLNFLLRIEGPSGLEATFSISAHDFIMVS